MRLVDLVAENVELNKVDIHIVVEGMKEALQTAQKMSGLKGSDIDLDVKKHRQKRSLNANSYERVLEGRIADALDSSKTEIHNLMLSRYGQYQTDKDGNIVYLLVPESVNVDKEEELHLKPTGHGEIKNGTQYFWYIQMKPSHEYNTQEMAKLIDGVVSECKELGIETLSEDEIRRLESERLYLGEQKDIRKQDME